MIVMALPKSRHAGVGLHDGRLEIFVTCSGIALIFPQAA